ncbi:DUF397 domain-containing protein [Streptomyces palmae]|uniref:DUF397 domain-containing protein n=1 Tax=Streptomyces palmae TaxID=1701085 RepID=A0A4Z0GQV2_9ACTN|nr:DUF397 domain-containing protein [Streptomyces palmae]TGA99697.1 DUF397 domain-containing protein [Streptomyces palmae]
MRSTPDLSTANWRKSSYSNIDGGDCVEIADNLHGVIPVRDSKDPDGPALVFGAAAWAAFIGDVKAGGLDFGAV